MSRFLSNINKIKDFIKIDKYKKIRSEIFHIIKNTLDETYDYGQGYFYQSLEKINLSGLRNSKKRIEQYKILEDIKNKEIIDIGTNSGFILFQLDNVFKNATGIEKNPKLIEVALKVKSFLNIKNVFFVKSDFLKHNFNNKRFDFMLSLANHSTYDKGISSTNVYFEKCNQLLKPGGFLLIEGHHPKYEKIKDFEILIINFIKKYNFKIKNEDFLKTGYFFDDGRKFYLLKKI